MEGRAGRILWNDRRSDVTHRGITLPFTINPQADGLSSADGEYYVVKIAFAGIPQELAYIEAKASH